MKQIGKKGKAWIKARTKLIKDAVANGRITINEAGNIYGRCDCCGKWRSLSPHHIKWRGRGGGHGQGNIEWLCNECHNEKHMSNKKKSKKPAWAIRHKCVKCKFESAHYICPNCGEPSIK